MPNNSFERITRFDTQAFDAVFAAESKSAIFQNGGKFIDVSFKEAGWVKLYNMQVDKLGNYVRAGATGGGTGYAQYNGTADRAGYPQGSASNGWDLYHLRYDRGRQLLVDNMDDEETAHQIMAHMQTEFWRTAIIPEIDTITFSTIASKCSTTLGNLAAAETIAANTILSKFDAAFQSMTELGVPEEDQVILVNPKVYTLLKQTTELTRYITQPDLKGVQRAVEAYSGREIKVVPSDRFYTEAAVGSNGYGPGVGSKLINFMVVSKKAIVPIRKLEHTRVLSGNNVPNFDGYIMDVRLYHDVIVPKNKVIGCYASVSAVAATTVANLLKVDIKYVSAGVFSLDNYFTVPAGINGTIVHGAAAFTVGTAYASAEKIYKDTDFNVIEVESTAVEDEYYAIIDNSTSIALAVSGKITLPTS